jgi:hypothetical protein
MRKKKTVAAIIIICALFLLAPTTIVTDLRGDFNIGNTGDANSNSYKLQLKAVSGGTDVYGGMYVDYSNEETRIGGPDGSSAWADLIAINQEYMIFLDQGTNADSLFIEFQADVGGTTQYGGIDLPQDIGGNGPALIFSTPDQNDGSKKNIFYLLYDTDAGDLLFAEDGTVNIGASGANRPDNYYGAGDMTVAGNVVGNTAAYDFIPIEWCHDGSVPPDAVAEVVSGNGKIQARDFGGAAGATVQDVVCPWEVPDNIVAASGIKYKTLAVITDATGPSTQGLSFKLSGYSVGYNDPINAGFGDEVETSRAGATLIQYDRFDTAYSTAVTVTNLAAGELAMLHFERDTADATDTYLKPIGVTGIRIQYQELSAGF